MSNRLSFLMTLLVAGCVTAPHTAPAPVPAAEPLYVLDGAEIRSADAYMIDQASIASVEVFKGAIAEPLYGARSRSGVVKIATKPEAGSAPPANTLFLLDGNEIPAELMRVLDTKRIDRIEVLKGQAVRAYSSSAQGVVLVTSKLD